MSFWDDPALKSEDSDFVKLEAVGDQFSGLITDLKLHKFDDGSTAPQVTFRDDITGDTKTWTAGQMQAKTKLKERETAVGDWFSARLDQIEKRGGGKTLKHITVVVCRGGKDGPTVVPGEDVESIAAATPTPTPAAAADPNAAPAGVDPAVWAQMGAEQRASLRAALGIK